MTPFRLSVAGRYAERHAIAQILAHANLDTLPVEITASWLNGTAESDADLTDAQAVAQVDQNVLEILSSQALLYVPSWSTRWDDLDPAMPSHEPRPIWSPGRLIDFGLAMGVMIPIIVVGRPEPTIYQRGELVTVCDWGTLRETIQRVLNMKD